jgi:hypothetical protein
MTVSPAPQSRQRESSGEKTHTQHFGYAVDRRYLPLLLPFLFKRDRDGVTLGDDMFEATRRSP